MNPLHKNIKTIKTTLDYQLNNLNHDNSQSRNQDTSTILTRLSFSKSLLASGRRNDIENTDLAAAKRRVCCCLTVFLKSTLTLTLQLENGYNDILENHQSHWIAQSHLVCQRLRKLVVPQPLNYPNMAPGPIHKKYFKKISQMIIDCHSTWQNS